MLFKTYRLIGPPSFPTMLSFTVLRVIKSILYGICLVYVESGLNYENMIEITISSDSNCSLDFLVLHVKDPFSTDLIKFHYSFIIDNCILDKNRFKQHDEHGIVL